MGFNNLNQSEWANFVYLSLLLIALSSSIIFRSHLKASTLIKQAFLWFIIALFIIVIYSFRYDFYNFKNRIIGELFPSRAIKISEGQIQIKSSDNGHYFIDLSINGQPVHFMIDTGASDVVLSPSDAQRIGIDINKLKFNKIYQTANGTVYGASIILKEVAIADLVLNNLPASVNTADMGVSLLGMSFLRQFRKYEFYQDRLVLTY